MAYPIPPGEGGPLPLQPPAYLGPLFDLPQAAGEIARDEAVERVGLSNANWISKVALPVIRAICEHGRRYRFTSDDVWEYVSDRKPREPRAMGAAFTQARRIGLIRPIDGWRKSKRPECHSRPVRVWEVV